jgi:hypothetical protein
LSQENVNYIGKSDRERKRRYKERRWVRSGEKRGEERAKSREFNAPRWVECQNVEQDAPSACRSPGISRCDCPGPSNTIVRVIRVIRVIRVQTDISYICQRIIVIIEIMRTRNVFS